MFTKCSFDKAENKLDYYRGRDCIEKLYKKLKEHAMKIINYEKKKEMIEFIEFMKKLSFIINKKYGIYVRKSFVQMNMMKLSFIINKKYLIYVRKSFVRMNMMKIMKIKKV